MSVQMKVLPATLGVSFALAVSGPVLAQSLPDATFYGSAGYTGLAGDKSLGDVDLGALTLKGGTRFGRYFGVEGEVGFGLHDDADQDINTKLKHQYAAYAVGYVPIKPNADLFARIGYGANSFVVDDYTTKTRPLGESLNLGVGGQYFFDERNGVRADYTHYDFRNTDAEADALTLSFIRKF